MKDFKNLEEFLPVFKNEEGENAVNARNLHAFLEIKKDFSDWIKMQIGRCDLIEDVDYQAFPQKVVAKNGFGYSTRIEYALSIDAAKELCQVSQTKKGKMARRYFIHCEKMLKKLKGDVNLIEVSGVAPLFYKGSVLYNYREICFATGVKPNSDRKKRTPKCFTKLYGQLFISMEYARLMEGRAKLRQLKEEAESLQLPLFPDDITQG